MPRMEKRLWSWYPYVYVWMLLGEILLNPIDMFSVFFIFTCKLCFGTLNIGLLVFNLWPLNSLLLNADNSNICGFFS